MVDHVADVLLYSGSPSPAFALVYESTYRMVRIQPVRELSPTYDGFHFVDVSLQDVEFADTTVVRTPSSLARDTIGHRLSRCLPTIL